MKKFLVAMMVLLVSLAGSSQPLKVFLHGAYSSTLARHKNLTAAWVAALNTGIGGNALSQPYWVAPFNYGTNSGPESVTSFPATTNTGTDILDWVLLELRDPITPSIVIASGTKAAFVLCNGNVVNHNDKSPVTFPALANTGPYHLVIRHRNHIAIRTMNTITLGPLGEVTYDFTDAQTKAYRDPAIINNTPMRNLGGGFFGMWGGNATGMEAPFLCYSRVNMGAPINCSDFFFLFFTTAGGNNGIILSNRYHPADMNMDATIRLTNIASVNDYLFLVSTLNNNLISVILQHQ